MGVPRKLVSNFVSFVIGVSLLLLVGCLQSTILTKAFTFNSIYNKRVHCIHPIYNKKIKCLHPIDTNGCITNINDRSSESTMAMLAETTRFVANESAVKNGSSTTTSIIGRSRGGDATAFAIPEFKWFFDCGAVVQEWKPRFIFLTHTHSDHVQCLFQFREEDRPPTVYLPEESLAYVENWFRAFEAMTECGSLAEDETNTKKAQLLLKGTKPDQDVFFSQGGNKFRMRTLKMTHRIPCLGYSIFRLKSRLRDEYTGLPSREIGRLRKSGVDVTTIEEEPVLCFMGDTTAKVFVDYPEIPKQHSIVVVECTFIDAESLQRAEMTRHAHWDDLQPHIASNPQTMFVLTHFSLKYSTLSLRRFFGDQQVIYDNIHPMLVEREIEDQWSKAGEEGKPPRCKCRMCRDQTICLQ